MTDNASPLVRLGAKKKIQITVTQHSDAFYGPQNRVRENEVNGAPLRWDLPGIWASDERMGILECCHGYRQYITERETTT